MFFIVCKNDNDMQAFSPFDLDNVSGIPQYLIPYKVCNISSSMSTNKLTELYCM